MSLTCITSFSTHRLIIYKDALLRYANILTRNGVLAEDLVQETYVRAIDSVARLKKNPNIKAWLFTILRNTWISDVRKQATRPIHQSLGGDHAIRDIPAGPSWDPQTAYASSALRKKLLEAIRQLPPEAQQVVVLREFEELSYEEIANVLKRPIGTVMSRLDRARARLRTLLGDLLDGEKSLTASRGR